MFEEELQCFLNIKKKGIWIKTIQEKEILVKLINIFSNYNIDHIFIWNQLTNLQEIITSKNNIYNKIPFTSENMNIQNMPLHLIYSNLLANSNDILDKDSNSCLILNDYDLYLENPQFIRMLREMFEINSEKYVPVIIISEKYEPPEKISHLFSVINYETPTEEEINNLLLAYEKNREVKIDNKKLICHKFLGFNKTEIIEILDTSFYKYNCVDLNILNNKKIELINSTDILDYKIPKIKLEDIGGNHNFKRWFKEIKICMNEDSTNYGVEKPKGYLALGIPGCSKTALAEAIANDLQIPYLILNMSKILSKFVGESEKKIEKAIKLIETCAPCVLLIDEVEKNLGGYASSNASDSGTLSRVFGKILDLLNNNDKGIFTVMTSNNVQDLPPELTRSGRLDCIWYFALPTEKEREEIFKIHFKKRNQNISDNLINYISQKTIGYTGAEIELIVKASIKKAYVYKIENNKDFIITKNILDKAKEDVIPISKSSKEKIFSLEVWSKGRALFANSTSSDEIDFNSINIDDINI